MVYVLRGVKRDSSGSYYYNSSDIPRISVPISKNCDGDMNLPPNVLDDCFGISHDTMPRLPQFMVHHRLTKECNGEEWTTVRGEIVVSKPIEWVPVVAVFDKYAKSMAKTTITRDTKTASTTKLFGKASGFAKLNTEAGGTLWGVKVEFESELKIEGKASHSYKLEAREKQKVEWKTGDEAMWEVAVTMMLKIEDVYTHSIEVRVKNHSAGRNTTLTWDGPGTWSDFYVPNWQVQNVKVDFEFHPVYARGTGYPESLYILPLPVLSEDKKSIKALHVLMSNKGWVHYHAYTSGKQQAPTGLREQYIAWPGCEPIFTLLGKSQLPGVEKVAIKD